MSVKRCVAENCYNVGAHIGISFHGRWSNQNKYSKYCVFHQAVSAEIVYKYKAETWTLGAEHWNSREMFESFLEINKDRIVGYREVAVK